VNDVQKCNASPHAHVVAYVSKLFPVRVSDLSPSDKLNHLSRLNARNNEQNNVFDELNLPNDSEVYVALARVFSGVLTPDKPLYLLNSRHNPFSMTSSNGDRDAIKDLSIPNCDQNPNPLTDFTIPSHVSETAQLIPPYSYSLYLCLGPTVHPVDSISAGNIAALFGFDDRILKSATLCSTMETYPMRSLSLGTTPLVRVAIEPVSHVDLKKLEIGLKLLYQYDPAVEVRCYLVQPCVCRYCLSKMDEYF
jgi:ribosome assembly protein 1